MPLTRGSRVYAVSITQTAPKGYPYTNILLTVIDHAQPYLFYIDESAFRLNNDDLRANENYESEFDLAADIKNALRRKEIPVRFGDWVSFYYDNSNVIYNFTRESALYERRNIAGQPQLLVDLIRSPSAPVLYNSSFGFIHLPENKADLYMTNVVFLGWISVDLSGGPMMEEVSIRFDDFHSLSYEDQIKQVDAPWMDVHKVPVLNMYDDEDELEGLIEFNTKQLDPNKIAGLAYFVGGRSLFCPEHPTKLFLLPLIGSSSLILGVAFKFYAFFSHLHDCFIVTRWELLADVNSLKTFKVDGRDYLSVSVNRREGYPTLFDASAKSDYGIVDDPTGCLNLFYLTRYNGNKCRVGLYEEFGGGLGRFRIGCVHPEKGAKIRRNIEMEEERRRVKGKGVVVSRDGRVFCEEHATLLIYVPEEEEFAVGMHVSFEADMADDGLFLVERGCAKQLKEDPLDYIQHNGRLLFRTTTVPHEAGQQLPLCNAKHFGLIDDPLHRLNIVKKSLLANPRVVWVCEAGSDGMGEKRVAQAPFFIVYVALNAERIPKFTTAKFIDAKGRDVGGFVRNREGKLIEMKDGSEAQMEDQFSSVISAPKNKKKQHGGKKKEKEIEEEEEEEIVRKKCGCRMDQEEGCVARKLLARIFNNRTVFDKIEDIKLRYNITSNLLDTQEL